MKYKWRAKLSRNQVVGALSPYGDNDDCGRMWLGLTASDVVESSHRKRG